MTNNILYIATSEIDFKQTGDTVTTEHFIIPAKVANIKQLYSLDTVLTELKRNKYRMIFIHDDTASVENRKAYDVIKTFVNGHAEYVTPSNTQIIYISNESKEELLNQLSELHPQVNIVAISRYEQLRNHMVTLNPEAYTFLKKELGDIEDARTNRA